MLNQKIQNYKIISLLGEGGMANVYLAENQLLGSKVAVKLLKEEFVQHPNIRKRFLAEARNLAQMSHPNIIKVTDLIDAGDIVAFVMEYIEGDTLEHYIEHNGKLPNEEIESFLKQMIGAVEYVHTQGLIHRDIKPSNFMLTKGGAIKLLDFGIAKNTNDDAADYTKTGLMQQMGTPMYMSPEQVKNTSEVTKETDIYSLGVVLWQMVTGKKPYDSDTLSLPEIQVAILKEPLPLTEKVWDIIIQSTTEKEKEKRISRIPELKGLLDSKNLYLQTEKILDNVITEHKSKREQNSIKGYFSIKNISIGLVVFSVFFVLILLFNKSKKVNETNVKVLTKSIDTIPEVVVSQSTFEKKDTNYQKIIRVPLDQQNEHLKNKATPKDVEKEEVVSIEEPEYDFVRMGDLEIMKNDLGLMNWYDANKKSQEIGNGWRLPTPLELAKLLTENKNTIGGFYGRYYWTSATAENVAFAIELRSFILTSYEKGTIYSVRMVKSVR